MSSENGSVEYDVAIVGGGPGGSTAASILKKYDPDIRVIVVEKERFPREHVGESQLPICTHVLDEMGCWEKVEAANFPIKLGASYTWGQDKETWDFNLFPPEQFTDEARPARFKGQRKHTAFQVERSIYDKILLDHAAELGAEVREETKVDEVLRDGDKIEGLRLSTGQVVRAEHYLDASGHIGVLRRAMGVKTEQPTKLRNIAFWDYWENTEWAVKIGIGGTRVQVRSLPFGWLWFIPLGPTRSSVGLVTTVDYYKECGLTPEELYDKAVREEPLVAEMTKNGSREGEIRSTTDWSFLSERIVGENWFLCGEAAGFADPILAAGMSLTHESAREVAYTILELRRGEHDGAWLREQYNERVRTSIWQHIRFALYWYSANGRFTDLQEYCQTIAKDAGLEMNLQDAWQWIAQGGFVNYGRTGPGFGSYDLASAKAIAELFHGETCDYSFDKFNVFKLSMDGAEETTVSEYKEGRISRQLCLERDGKYMPVTGSFLTVQQTLQKVTDIDEIMGLWNTMVTRRLEPAARDQMMTLLLQTLEAMVLEGWVEAERDWKKPLSKRDKENPFKKTMKGDRSVQLSSGLAGESNGGAGVPAKPAAGRATKKKRFKKR